MLNYRYLAVFLAGATFANAQIQQLSGFEALPAALQTSATTARRNLAGSVVNSVTGEPIGRALVRLNGPEARSAFTGPDGRFEFANVPEGQVNLSAQKPGFSPEGVQPGRGARGGSFFRAGMHAFRFDLFTLGPNTGDAVLKLAPDARIKGRITDENGEPVESMNVQLLWQTVTEGQKRWQVRGGATTDDTGEYVLDGLGAGTYAVHTQAFPLPPEATAGAPGTAPLSQVYPRVYYSNAPDLASAQPMEVTAGQEASADFKLAPAAGFRVSGVFPAGNGGVNIDCEDAEGQVVSGASRVDTNTGRFTLTGIPAGEWIVHAVFWPAGGGQQGGEAFQSIAVTSSDITGVVLRPERLPDILVSVQGGEETAQPYLQMTQKSGMQSRTYQAFRDAGKPNEPLAFHAVAPGAYQVTVRLNGPGCVSALSQGGVDLFRDGLTVNAGSPPGPIEVTLSNDCGSVSGSVVAGGQPAQGTVVLLGDAPANTTLANAGPDGKFSVAGLRPGNYRAFAFSDVNGLEYANPEVMRAFPGVAVELGSQGKSTVELELIASGQ